MLVAAVCGCGGIPGANLAPSDARSVRSAPKDPNKCIVAATHREPLVTEWSASSKARLEILLTATLTDTDRYAVAVEYTGCELRIVDTCRPKGSYDWSKSTLSRDTVEINDADDLYAKLPLGAVQLEGALKRSGRLSIQTTVAGQIILKRTSIDFNALVDEPSCAEATHIIEAVSIGAFKMVEGGRGQASAGGGVTGIAHAGASTSRNEQVMREAGEDGECHHATKGEPHASCRSPLQLFLLPIPHRAERITLKPTPTLPDAPTPVSPPPATRPSEPVAVENPPSSIQKPTPKTSTLRTLSYIFGGCAIAGLGGGAVSLGVSGGIENTIRNGRYATLEDMTSAQSTMSTTRALGAGGLISGGILLGLAVPLFIFGGK